MSISNEVDALIGAIRFFTRLSLPGQRGQCRASLARAMLYFPAAGLVVGACAALTYTLAALFWPKTLAVLAAIALAIYLTGALHEDGWCDMADGFGGGTSRERVLEIMRDSSVGSYGALALIVLLFGRFFSLLEIDAVLVAPALIAGHAVSRLCSTLVMATLDYARPQGKASPFTHRLTRAELALAALPALLPCFWLPRASVLAGLVLAALSTFWLARLFSRRLGGYTGDCLGATQQAAELMFYLGLLVRIG
jgi:adenosylcobinamide-GDP ribazoletransferase